jgi:hypothetical protein
MVDPDISPTPHVKDWLIKVPQGETPFREDAEEEWDMVYFWPEH